MRCSLLENIEGARKLIFRRAYHNQAIKVESREGCEEGTLLVKCFTPTFKISYPVYSNDHQAQVKVKHKHPLEQGVGKLLSCLSR